MKHPLVSVVIPVFNAARFLRQAVESVKAQAYQSLEIIAVDDGSTDDSLAIASDLGGVRVFRQENKGAAAARNLGVNQANGTYLGFLDADDLWAPDKLSKQVKVFQEHPNTHLVAGRVEEFYEAGHIENAQRQKRQSGDRAYTIGALLVRREDFQKVGPLDASLEMGEFMDWRSRAMALGYKEHILPDVVLNRRIHGSNKTIQRAGLDRHYLTTIRLHIKRKRESTDRLGGASS